MRINYTHKLLAVLIAGGSLAGMAMTVAARWYRVEDGVLVSLPAIAHRVDDHDAKFDQVGDAISALADAALVDKAKQKARRAECMKFVRAGKLREEDCPEVSE